MKKNHTHWPVAVMQTNVTCEHVDEVGKKLTVSEINMNRCHVHNPHPPNTPKPGTRHNSPLYTQIIRHDKSIISKRVAGRVTDNVLPYG